MLWRWKFSSVLFFGVQQKNPFCSLVRCIFHSRLTSYRKTHRFEDEEVQIDNRPFSYSENECESNEISLHFVEFSNVHNCGRSSNATQSNLTHKVV